MARKELSYEQAFSRLQEIVGKLEQGDLPLEDWMKLYQEGVGLVGQCRKKLDDAQGLIEKLVETPDGGVSTEPMPLDALGK